MSLIETTITLCIVGIIFMANNELLAKVCILAASIQV